MASGNIPVRVERKDGAPIEWAVIFWVVEPALGVVRVDTAQADADNMAACMRKERK
jgi:uncharacterized membrane protein YraQ (UPF0718 family)